MREGPKGAISAQIAVLVSQVQAMIGTMNRLMEQTE
jgi:hypothetical protein